MALRNDTSGFTFKTVFQLKKNKKTLITNQSAPCFKKFERLKCSTSLNNQTVIVHCCGC